MNKNIKFILVLGDIKVVALNAQDNKEVFVNLGDQKRKESMQRIADAIVSY